jgi:hypothetical protein
MFNFDDADRLLIATLQVMTWKSDVLHRPILAGTDRGAEAAQARGEDPAGGDDVAAEGAGGLRGVQDQEAGVH